MVHVKTISVQNFRSHDDYSLKLDPKTTVITGKNGSGKTSLIEALYIALQGSSFRGSDGDILKHTTDWYRIDVEFSDGMKRTVKFDSLKQMGKKQFSINDSIFYRLLSKDKYPVVLFEPNDLRLLDGSPTRRRHFIDQFISQVDPQYIVSLRKYERALKQRNNLLKRHSITNDEMFAWEVLLSEYGAYIIIERIAFIERLNKSLSETYNDIAKSSDNISIHYSETLVGDVKGKLLTQLTKSIQRDKILGYTSVGPHRSDIVINLNGTPARHSASRGENRTIILALKTLEVDIIEQISDMRPIVLLDDVFSDLDSDRKETLVPLFIKNQTIITSTDQIKNLVNQDINL